jgi:AcrR family transcriptional regulator
MAVTASRRKYEMTARAEMVAANGERMLAAAWQRFSTSPYDEVRLADVARDSGATIQTLHARFGRKDRLFVAAWQWKMRPEGARRDMAPVGDVSAAVRLLYDSYERDADAVIRLLAEEERIPAVREMADSGRDWHRGWVERTFASLHADLRGAARERRIVSLVVATDLQVWKLLRRDMKLGRKAAERIVVDMITTTKGAP